MSDLPTRLERIVLGTPWLVEMLRVVRSDGPPDAYLGAGVIRNVVWDSLNSSQPTNLARDVDVVFFEPNAEPVDWTRRLDVALPGYCWDVTNQAEVHIWQSRELGNPIPPYRSLEAAVASWPETATAIAVRLCERDAFKVIAPYGLSDLFDLHVRPSPGLKDPNAYASRLRSKQWRLRWPNLTVHHTVV